MLSAAFTSVAGSLYSIKTGFIDPESGFGMLVSVQMLIIAALGGAGTLFGPLVGALILVPLQAATNTWFGGGGSGLTYILYGGIIVAACALRAGRALRVLASRLEYGGGRAMLLEAKGVSKAFGSFLAVRNADLTVEEGEIIGLIGPNGAGKSTFFNCLAGDAVPTSGTVSFDGVDLTRASPEVHARAGIGRTFQVPATFEDMTVLENVMVGAYLRHPHRTDAREKALEVLEITGLARFADQRARGLGTPGRKRLEIARVLALEPRLMLLDEALAGLTPSEIQRAVELLRRIHGMGITLVIVEHIMEVIMTLAARVIVFNQGHVIAQGAPEDVVKDEGVIQAYLGRNHGKRRERARPIDGARLMQRRRNLEVRYGDLVGVADVSLDVPPGSVVALVGSNGAGKTTTLNAIAGLVPPSGGAIEWRGQAITRQPAYAIVQQGPRAVAGGLAAFRLADGRAEPSPRHDVAEGPLARGAAVRARLCAVSAARRSGAASLPARCRAASGRCWRSAAR